MSSIYDELGLTKMINAAGTYTVLGGSRMSAKTIEDIKSASENFVQIRDMQKVVNAKIAELTKNEAAYVTNGATCALYLATCAAVQRKLNKGRFFYLTREEIESCNVVLFKSHRNPYDFTIGQAGAQYKEIGYPNFILPGTCEDLEQTIDDKTCMIYYVHAVWTPEGALDLENTIRIAHEHNIPVVVDAAAQLPPIENLWKFTTDMGADAVLFSGGKDIRGPQSSGMILGKKDFIEIVAGLGFPTYGVGRMLKVGREEQIGLYSALKQYVEMDHDARAEWCEGEVKKIIDAFADSKCFRPERSFPNEAGQPIARTLVKVITNKFNALDIKEKLLSGTPSIFCMEENEQGFFVNPMTMYEGETEIFIKRLKEIEKELNN